MRSVAYAAVWLFVFSVPWENVLIIPGIGVISRVTGMLAVALMLVAVVISARVRRWHAFHLTALVFLIWAGGVLWIRSTEAVLPLKFWTYLQLFLVLWMIWELAPTPRRQLGLLVAYVFGAHVTAFQTIMAYRTHGGGMRRFTAGATDPNDVAMTLALALPMAWYLGMTHRRPLVRWICRAYLPAGLFGIGLTGSRGGMIAAVVGLTIVPLTMTKLSPGKLVIAIALLALSGALAVAYVPDTLLQRLATTGNSVEDLTLGGRFDIWKAGFHAFARRPLTGYGSGAFKQAASPWLGGQLRVAHNSYLSVLVEQGIVGFLLYAMMFVVVFLASRQLPTVERRLCFILLATLAVAMLPLSWEERKPVWIILASVLGLAKAQRPGQRRGVPPTHRTERIARPPLRPLTAVRNTDPSSAT